VLSEQELAELGIVRPDGDAARRGQMRGARYLVLGTLTSFDSNVEAQGGGSDFGLLGFRQRRSDVETRDYVAIDIRVVDSTTGEVVGFRTVEGRATSTGAERENGFSLLPAAGAALLLAPNMGRTGQVLTGAAGTLRFGSSSAEAQRTPAAKAVRAALVEAADYVNCVLVPRGDCMARFEAIDRERRQRTRGVLQLD
jgi:curli biogenesis system outer membrane secretion channel CsgG